MKEEGLSIILVNPNIATIQTSEGMADEIYFVPVNAEFVERIIEKEKPDGILLGFGGQTALNCGVELSEKGVFEKYNVKVLGTPVEAIQNTEDRHLFIKKLTEINLKVPKGRAVTNVLEATEAGKEIGYPVMIRIAYALGGRGSGVAKNQKELVEIAEKAFTHTNQILVEEYLRGWKEIEYEVVRDQFDNCITVCNMENIDPMGIHTGESIVVAPSQTLTNSEYHKLRQISIKVIRHLGIVGECNIQFALDPASEDYRIIEVNARLSRSSALASKATGYPLAFIAAKLALGHSLIKLLNSITKSTMACFEPALDYCVLKIPRWDIQKFKRASVRIGSEMKSVGEIMAIGRKFEEAIQKAIRMLAIDANGLVCNNNFKFEDLENELEFPTDKRIFAVVEALKKGYTIDKIHNLSRIDKWFLYKIKNVVDLEKDLQQHNINNVPSKLLRKAKQYGFSDKQLAILLNSEEIKVRKTRKNLGITPVVKQIDTLAAEYPSVTNYLYLTYNGDEDDITFQDKNKVIVLGSGAYRIGSSVEFDWCCVNAVFTLRDSRYRTIMINHNPETVSTDYDVCDKLYFDELSFETVMDVYEKENPLGIILSMGGQIPNNLAMPLQKAGAKILGTSPLSIDNAEDRFKFSKLCDSLGIDQPEWRELSSIEDAKLFAQKVGYPVLVRPSYVLSGSAMNVVLDDRHLETYLKKASDVSKEHPVVISKFIANAKEIEIDAVAKNGKLLVHAITEHVENAGVHSGDATMVLPPQKTYLETTKRIKEIAEKIAFSLKITGPFNIQFIAKENEVKVIECNLRASRSFPFVSKVYKLNFIDLATKAIIGDRVTRPRYITELDYVGVKSPQFSFSRLSEADPVLDVEMTSTGEVACLGTDVNDALLKSMISTGLKMPKNNVLVSISGDKNRYKFLDSFKKLREIGFNIYATEHTSLFLEEHGLPNKMLFKIHETKFYGRRVYNALLEIREYGLRKFLKRQIRKSSGENVLDYLMAGKLDLVINVPRDYTEDELKDEYKIRRLAVDFSIPLITNTQLAELYIESLYRKRHKPLEIKAWSEY